MKWSKNEPIKYSTSEGKILGYIKNYVGSDESVALRVMDGGLVQINHWNASS